VGQEWRAQIRAGLVIGVGLLLALAATVAPLPPASGEPGASVTVRLPDAVRTVVVALLALSAILLLAMQRPRRPAEDDPLSSRAYQQRPVWAAVLSLLPILMLVAAAWYLVWNRAAGEDAHPIERAFTAIAGFLDFLARSRKAPASVPFFDLTIAALVLVVAVAIFALMVLLTLAERLETWWGGRATGAAAPPLADRFGDRDDLRAEPDPRMAVIRAYGRFEHALANARLPRAPWQTPAEFMRTTLARLPVPILPVERLTALFEIARFSDRPLGADARTAACDCLDEITTALETEPLASQTAHPRFTAARRSDTEEPPPSETAHPRVKPAKRDR
jgi:hypothetical protein